MSNFKKTIFIIISRGILVRNILRTTLLKELTDGENIRIVLLFPGRNNVPVPDYLYKEFASDKVEIEIVPHNQISSAERFFNHWVTNKLVFSRSTVIYMKYHIKSERRVTGISFMIYKIVYGLLSRWQWLKKFFRWFDLKFINQHSQYAAYFDKYKPDLVFSTSIVSNLDVDIMKEARRRKIKVISMPRSWDNLDKFLFRLEPDILLVQNESMKKEAVQYQALQPESIKVVGFPQFDMYVEPSLRWTKEEYCRHKNFDPRLPILFLGSEGKWSEGDDKIFRSIVEARGQSIPDCNVLIRPHFSAIRENNYHQVFQNYKNVYIDDSFTKSDFWHDNWDPNWNDMVDFTNSLYHANIMITFASTLAIDFACFNKPIIAISYGVKFINGQDMTKVMYDTIHYQWVVQTMAISLVKDQAQLLMTIKHCLGNSQDKQAEQQQLSRQLAYKLDGQSTRRIVEVLLETLYNNQNYIS